MTAYVNALDMVAAEIAVLRMEHAVADPARRARLVERYACLEEAATSLRALVPERPEPVPFVRDVTPPSRRAALPPPPTFRILVTPSGAWWTSASPDGFTATAAGRAR